MKSVQIPSSVQRDLLSVRETSGEMLCLYSPSSPTRRSYRAVLEVAPINLALKAEDEQEAIIERFGALVRSLSYPLQVLVRNQRLDLSPYVERLLTPPVGGRPSTPTGLALAASLADLLRRIAAERTLIERHVYLIIPADPRAGRPRHKGTVSLFGRRRAQRQFETRELARQELTLRMEALSQQLASCGLTSRRLHNDELARLYYGCLTPERALAHPLPAQLLAAVGRPSKMKRPAKHMPGTERVLSTGSEQHREAALRAMDAAQRSLPAPDLLPLVDLLAPECIEVTPDALRIGQEYACGLAVTACPREVSFDGWLAPLVLHDDVFDLTFHYHPQDTASMKRQLARNRAGHASGRRFNQREGRADDPDALVAEEDLGRLLDDLARSCERVFDLGLYLLVRASNREALADRVERLYSVLGLLLLDAATHSTTYEQVEALQSCLPQARDVLLRTNTLDSTTLATMFLFLSNSIIMPDGLLVGISETHEPVLLNPWDGSLENPHLFIGGVTGSGKSYLGKLLVERDLLMHGQRGDQSFVIDPDLEYQHLCEALGGTVVRLAPGSLQRLNPFDLLPPRCDFHIYLAQASRGDRLAEKMLDLHAMLDILLAEDASPAVPGSGMLTKREKGLLDRALYDAYLQEGITSDPYQGPDRQYTLLDVVALLRLPSFRHTVLEQVRDGLLLDWWQHYYEPMDAHQQREITSSVITKLSKFASSRVARRILGQPRSTLDLREVVRQSKLLLVSTASGVVGADLSELIGIVLLGLFEAALAEQASVPFEQRRRYLVLIDEFQVYRGANYQGMLAELRKYGGSFALATQSLAYLDRLDRTLRATVLANIDHLFAFHMAGEDAHLLHELDGILEDDITNLDDFQCYVKLSLGGHRLLVFSLQLDAPPLPDQEGAQMVRLRSRGRDARPAGSRWACPRRSRKHTTPQEAWQRQP